ncbi:helix-turn-helix domain-containing protein [Mucilaginibacter sp. SG564]|uniref:helix-turn-helix domain-containing protein n=1 Tax=Mucilaginibacter sp. SG564 TaxID=2587022 RepID=UPI001557E9C2|nr:helix-turn-helix domain-containing protein [Mucilaginibacter sp. SG564]NOW99218.1 transposase [Mucilaginibacter sp. SG564]
MIRYKKHKTEFKLKLIKAHEGGESINSLSKRWNISTSQIRKWIDQYNSSGLQGISRKGKQQYSEEFKLTVVQAYVQKNLSLRDCCLQFGIPSIGIVSVWVQAHEHLGAKGLISQPKGRKAVKEKKPRAKTDKPLTRLEELEKENLYLRAENELLKKLEALAQNKETTPKKKR